MRRAKGLFAGLLLAIVWQAAAQSGFLNPMVFPSFLDVLANLYEGLFNGLLGVQILYSLKLIGIGLAISAILALSSGFLCLKSGAVRRWFETIVILLHPLPGVALLPLIILWFGTGETAIIIIIVHGAFWPLMQNVLQGMRQMPDIYLKIGENYGFSTREKTLQILLPAAAPFILAGFKIAWARAWRALISAEMIFGAAGLAGGIGWAIYRSRVFMDAAGIVSGLLVIMAIGIFVEHALFRAIENRTVRKWGMME